MRYLHTFIFVFIVFLQACNNETESGHSSIYFEAIDAEDSGMNFSNDLFHQDDLNIIEYLYYYNGGGVAIGDINNDGLDDVYLTANQKPDKLFLNLGQMKFQDITVDSGIFIDSTWSTGVTMEDINNDGYLDIYVSKVGNYKGLNSHNQLYINNGDLTFNESSSNYGLDFSGLSTQASFFDYDNDGDMDMYLMNHAVHTTRSYGNSTKRFENDTLAGDRLYENKLDEGKQIFINVTQDAGIYNSPLGYGLAIKTSDINQDGLIDIYIGNDFHENDYIYINQGDKTFKESSESYFNHSSRFTMGVDIADLNDDGLLDIFTLDMMAFDKKIFLKSGGEDSDKVSLIKKRFGFQTQYARNTFQLNNGNGTFSDIALQTNTHATDWSWSVLIEDYDNDGLSDIYVTNGIYKRPNDLDYVNYLSSIDFQQYNLTQQNEIEKKLIQEMPTINISNIIFKNKGNFEFQKTTEASGLNPSYSNGAAYGDLDNDGDMDLIVNNINQSVSVLENRSEIHKNNYINISLLGDDSLKNPSGAKIQLFTKGHEYYKELSPTRGFQSSSSRKIHFGLGQEALIDSIRIIWLDGQTQVEKNLTINSDHTIKRNIQNQIEVQVKHRNEEVYEVFPFVHIENKYLDYEKESLMPEKLSVEGPAIVSADLNSDGLEDLYIGGAKFQSAELYIQQPEGGFKKIAHEIFDHDAIYEDTDADVIDIDNDGDLDLYVISGGSDQIEGDPQFEDRIYLNNGDAHFERFQAELIKTNGSSISVADFDNDGFDDLFIGSRSIPGGYGLSPYSFILKNTGNSNFEIVEKTALGMVTDSQWVDINNDGNLDLVVVGDWMPVTVLINKGEGNFSDETKNLGLSETQGMWNTISITDVDHNGQKDLILGNAGLNFKLKASTDRPIKLYLDDFDGNSQLDPIIYYDFFGDYIPFASKDKLIGQMPYLKKKFLNYSTFSTLKDIEDLTGKPEKDILEMKKIAELRSMIYLNFGDRFEGVPLPKEAQMSSIQDFEIKKNDEVTKLIYVGNYNDYVTELGSSNANSGGTINMFKNGEFGEIKQLTLPKHLNTRKITRINKDQYLVLSNNDKSYMINVSQ